MTNLTVTTLRLNDISRESHARARMYRNLNNHENDDDDEDDDASKVQKNLALARGVC